MVLKDTVDETVLRAVLASQTVVLKIGVENCSGVILLEINWELETKGILVTGWLVPKAGGAWVTPKTFEVDCGVDCGVETLKVGAVLDPPKRLFGLANACPPNMEPGLELFEKLVAVPKMDALTVDVEVPKIVLEFGVVDEVANGLPGDALELPNTDDPCDCEVVGVPNMELVGMVFVPKTDADDCVVEDGAKTLLLVELKTACCLKAVVELAVKVGLDCADCPKTWVDGVVPPKTELLLFPPNIDAEAIGLANVVFPPKLGFGENTDVVSLLVLP